MKSTILSVLCLGAAVAASASEPLTLTFHRTGTDAQSVTVTSSLPGVSASLESVSHSLKAIGNETLCPDVNGSTNPSIVYSFTLSGLPDDWSFNHVGLDITAYNASGATQMTGDGKHRQFNVNVVANNYNVATFTDLDPAAGVANARKVWETSTGLKVNTGSAATLTIIVTKGTENVGCFFGLNSISLTTQSAPANKVYNIKWKNNTQDYMTAMSDGSIQIGGYSINNAIFWEFIPTNKKNCYYIKNTANGLYLGSCNMNPNSASRISLSATPVEYYVDLSASTDGANAGCYWMSSTDCANYSDESKGPRALNKDGGSNYIITWTAGVGNVGSYWQLVETTDLYEIRAFAVGSPYHIADIFNMVLNYEFDWVSYSPTVKNASWIFSGTSNAAGGYQIVNAQTNEPINNGARYKVVANGDKFSFETANGSLLDLGGSEKFTFIRARSNFELNNRIFQMPCGQIADTWIASVSCGDFHYPMATASNGNLYAGTLLSAPRKYEILTRDAITASPGSLVELAISLNKAPTDAYTLMFFADYDRDGVFERSFEIDCAQTMKAGFIVPEDAKLGDVRLRLRLSCNGLNGADDDVRGEILDLRLNVVDPGTTLFDPIVKANDNTRGTAEWANNLATATSKGNALFLYWQEAMRVVGANNELAVEPSARQRNLTAVFSANTDKVDGIDPVLLNTVNTKAQITFNGAEIAVEGAKAISLLLFNLNGQLVAATEASVLSVSDLTTGIYIAKAITSEGVVSSKIIKP